MYRDLSLGDCIQEVNLATDGLTYCLKWAASHKLAKIPEKNSEEPSNPPKIGGVTSHSCYATRRSSGSHTCFDFHGNYQKRNSSPQSPHGGLKDSSAKCQDRELSV